MLLPKGYYDTESLIKELNGGLFTFPPINFTMEYKFDHTEGNTMYFIMAEEKQTDKAQDKNTIVMPKIRKVTFYNECATVVEWSDGTLTRVSVKGGDEFVPEVGVAMCIAKKYSGSYERLQRSVERGKIRYT